MKTLTLLILIIVFSCVAAPPQVTTIYTTLSKKCRTISRHSTPIDSFEAECLGVGGYKVRWVEGDSRESINILTPAKHKFELDFWSFLSQFSSLGNKLEWRVRKGTPFALIARMTVSGDDQKPKSYLIVSKIGRKESCVVDLIEPGAKQNENARMSADSASGKPCKTVQ